jgi:hypothetical protein
MEHYDDEEITEETYLLFLEHIKEYRKVLNG